MTFGQNSISTVEQVIFQTTTSHTEFLCFRYINVRIEPERIPSAKSLQVSLICLDRTQFLSSSPSWRVFSFLFHIFQYLGGCAWQRCMARRRREWFGSGLSGLAQRHQCHQEPPWLFQHSSDPGYFWRGSADMPSGTVLLANVSATSVSTCIKLLKLLGKRHKPMTCSVPLRCRKGHVLHVHLCAACTAEPVS